MKPDHEGFLMPHLDSSRCLHCGLCSKVCPTTQAILQSHRPPDPIQAFAAWHKDSDIRYQSSSGGAFTALSDVILSRHGSIYGVGFDEQMQVCHQRATTAETRDRFRGSKYVQSALQQCFSLIFKDLQDGISVLFTGTPCQCRAVQLLCDARNLQGNLYICDVVCAGVQSPLIWREHLKFLQSLYPKSSISDYLFRSKLKGWRHSIEEVRYHDGHVDHSSPESQMLRHLFGRRVCLRPACYRCPFTSMQRSTDLTLSDFWNLKQVFPEWDSPLGVSSILVHSQRGAKLLQATQMLELKSCPIEATSQPRLQSPSEKPTTRARFWQKFHKIGYTRMMRLTLQRKLKNRLVQIIRTVRHL